MTPENQALLLQLAGQAIGDYLKTGQITFPPLASIPLELQSPAAVFVTLRVNDTLRGCIGNLTLGLPLAHEVMATAVGSATEDSRFPVVGAEELSDLQIEISILSPFQRIQAPDDIVPGKHGVMVTYGSKRGLFLPQVWETTEWDRTKFLNDLCEMKAGLPASAWKDSRTEIYVFEVEAFSTKKA